MNHALYCCMFVSLTICLDGYRRRLGWHRNTRMRKSPTWSRSTCADSAGSCTTITKVIIPCTRSCCPYLQLRLMTICRAQDLSAAMWPLHDEWSRVANIFTYLHIHRLFHRQSTPTTSMTYRQIDLQSTVTLACFHLQFLDSCSSWDEDFNVPSRIYVVGEFQDLQKVKCARTGQPQLMRTA